MYTDFFELWLNLGGAFCSRSVSSAQEMNRQFLAKSAEEADFVVLEHCVTYAYHVLSSILRWISAHDLMPTYAI